MKYFPQLLLLVLFFSCKQDPQENLELGNINIEVSAEGEAKSVFTEAMLMLHSFEYKDAADKFRAAQELSPDFAMAYWGEAMTHNHPLWREQDLKAARAIMEKLGETPEEQRAKFKTEFEKDMFDGLSILYGSGSKAQRDVAYMEKMKALHEKYPDNHEVSALYALSLLGSVKGGRDFDVYAKGAKIAQSVIKENPQHPGALHYLIHSFDDPDNAHKALDAANSYSKVAPDAGHALHMPSHIYVAMGMWDEVISSNIASWEASVKRKEEKDLDNDALNYHAYQWLMYGYLQKGEIEKARAILENVQNYCYELASKRSVFHLAMMKAAYFIESDQWEDSLRTDTINYDAYGFYARIVKDFTDGMHAYRNGDAELLAQLSDSISYLVNAHTNESITGSGPMCSGRYSLDAPSQLEIARASVLQKELAALLAILNKDELSAESLLKESVAMEQSTSYNFGPPEIVKPSSELYAEYLIERGRHEEAKKQLDLVVKRAPGRRLIQSNLDMIKKST